VAVNVQPLPWPENRRRIELLDDGRPFDRGSRLKVTARVDRGLVLGTRKVNCTGPPRFGRMLRRVTGTERQRLQVHLDRDPNATDLDRLIAACVTVHALMFTVEIFRKLIDSERTVVNGNLQLVALAEVPLAERSTDN